MMKRMKTLCLLLLMIVCFTLFSRIARAERAQRISISSYGSINYSTSPTNLAVIPEDWHLTYSSGPQIIHLDYDITHNGHVSIRLDPHTSADINMARECNGKWYPIKSGDHVVARIWIKTGTNSSTAGYPYCGGRIGFDFYGYVNGVYRQLCGTSSASGRITAQQNDAETRANWVQDSNGGIWQQRTIDFIVPATVPYVYGDWSQQVPRDIVMWMQAGPWVEEPTAVPVWFADAELYINP